VNTFEQIFTYSDLASASLTEAEEIDTIARAQAGDETATETLLLAYGPAIRSAISNVAGLTGGDAPVDLDDVRMTAIEGALTAIRAHDPEKGARLAGTIRQYVADALSEEFAASRPALQVPSRTLSRFFGILREADGDVETARGLAGERGMRETTFDLILAAARPGSIEALRDPNGDGDLRDLVAEPVYTTSPVVDVEDAILVDLAFRAVDDEEERICRLSYGFTEYDPQPDAEIAHRMGLTRPTVQRKRGKALGKMRKALGVTPVA
jgi:RNA polymerase sigma factor (sigma-70 family)